MLDRDPPSTGDHPDPRAGGPREQLVKERASATPIGDVAAARAPEGRRTERPGTKIKVGIAKMLPLADVQHWFSSVVTHPKSAEDGIKANASLLDRFDVVDLEEVVTAGPKLSAAERIGLYQYGYYARLVECLADDYPVLQHALGGERFDALARRYIEACPSRDPNLNFFGRRLPAFCLEQGAWLEEHVFASELARLEWAMVEVFHARAAPVLSAAQLQAIREEDWPMLELPPSPTLIVEEMTHPVNRYRQAVREERKVSIPKPGWSATAIYRQEYTIWRMDLTRPMHRVLRALIDGETLGAALDLVAAGPSSVGQVMVWFKEWIEGGFFSRIELDGSGGRTTPRARVERSTKRKGKRSK
jgi:hypothetical protein